MRHQLPASLLLLACLAACQVVPVVPLHRASEASSSPTSASGSPPAVAMVASATAVASASPAHAAGLAPASRLLGKPATPFRTLAGTLQMDARYAVDASAGKVISDNGGAVLGNHGGSLVSNNSGSVLVVGAGIISDAGALMLSKGNLISEGGNKAIAPGSSSYALQAADAKVPIGTIVPAAGMALRAEAIDTGKSVPLGVAPDGSPVYEIYTNGGGQYEVYLPAEVADKVLVTARVPGNADTRLAYDLLSSKAKASADIDEDTAKATYYVRNSYAQTWAKRLRGIEPMGLAGAGEGYGGDNGGEAVTTGSTRLARAAADAHLAQLSNDAIQALALRITDLILTRMDPATAPIAKHTFNFTYTGPDESIFDAYAGVVKLGREAVTSQMREAEANGQDPLAFFNTKPYLVEANKGRTTPYVIKKPGDLVDFVADYYLTGMSSVDQTGPVGALAVMSDVGLSLDVLERFIAASAGMGQAESQVMYLDAHPLVDQVIAIVQAAGTPPSPKPGG